MIIRLQTTMLTVINSSKRSFELFCSLDGSSLLLVFLVSLSFNERKDNVVEINFSLVVNKRSPRPQLSLALCTIATYSFGWLIFVESKDIERNICI